MPLAGFRRLRQHLKLLEELRHFCGFGSANAVLLADYMERWTRWDVIACHISVCLFPSSLRPPPESAAQPMQTGAGKVKSLVTATTPSYASRHGTILTQFKKVFKGLG